MRKSSFRSLFRLIMLFCVIVLLLLTATQAQAQAGTGTILREYWNNISGMTITNLTSNPNNPSGSEQLTSLEGPTNVGENYGAHRGGYPPGHGQAGALLLQHGRHELHATGTFTMGNAWQFFMGYRYAIFNYATQSLGGSVTVDSFTMTTP